MGCGAHPPCRRKAVTQLLWPKKTSVKLQSAENTSDSGTLQNSLPMLYILWQCA
jgi:hypothetical protein